MCLELTVKLKNEDGSKCLTHKELVYEMILLNCEGEDPYLSVRDYVNKAILEFGEEPDSVKIRITQEVDRASKEGDK